MSSNTNMTCKASCTMISQLGASNQIMGHISIVQPLPSGSNSANSTVRITGTIHHLQPKTIHGISICQAGDLSNGATSCGPIFNPFGKSHGGPNDEQRMVGDLGNITVDETGTASIHMILDQNKVSLYGPHSIIGRSIVIYAGADDMGRGGQEHSLSTGNTGPRIAAGIIGLAL